MEYLRLGLALYCGLMAAASLASARVVHERMTDGAPLLIVSGVHLIAAAILLL